MRMTRVLAVAAGLALTAGVAAAPPTSAASSADPSGARPQASPAAEPTDARRAPNLKVRTVKGGLDIPWDLTFLPGGGMLYTQRDREALRYRGPNGADRPVRIRTKKIWHSGETGLMSILAARDFKKSRHFLTCHGAFAKTKSGRDVRVVLWKLAKNFSRARQVRTIVKGLPANNGTFPGRHGGCRLEYGPKGALFIGTGDSARNGHSQNLKSGGGKVLRVRAKTGKPWPGNPYRGASKPIKRKIYTHGHRNVQGLARRPGGAMWSVEHGTSRDDEANILRKGGDYGWKPGPGYDESRPMTDFGLPGKQIGARWRSGSPTIAPSGATWLKGKKWGVWRGCLALGVLGSSQLRILKFTDKGKFVRSWVRLDGSTRLRSVVLGPNNNLYATTANGGGNDRILKIVPRR